MAEGQEMSARIGPEEAKLLIRWLRAIRDWSQAQLATATGIDRRSIIRYENGQVPPRRTLERLVSAVGLPIALLDACLIPVVILVCRARHLPGDEVFSELGAAAAELDSCLSTLARPRLAALLLHMASSEIEARRSTTPSSADWYRLPDLWERFASCTPEERRYLIELAPEFRDWTLVVRLCEESAKVAADSAKDALELAKLARYLARLVPGEDTWHSLLLGYAEAFVANAIRVGGDPKAAEAAFECAWHLWRAGTSPEPGLVPGWRLLDLEASLRRDQRQWSRALDLLDQALAQAPPEMHGRILLNKSSILVPMGKAELAIEVLRDAAPLIDRVGEPRLLWVHRFNLAAYLSLLGGFRDAESLLPDVWRLAADLGNSLDLVRCLWLQGQVAAGLGRALEAEAALRRVFTAFSGLNITYDAALVALELSVLYIEQGRTREVCQLVEKEMLWIFAAQEIREETFKALAVFREATRQETATVELARRLVSYLTQARTAPGLTFEP